MTSGIPFYTADVFTSEMFGGNQLAVFPAATGLDIRLMRAIAKELNLSETVFVFPPEDPSHTRKLRIFTPGTELPFAGHPTLGAAVRHDQGAGRPPYRGAGHPQYGYASAVPVRAGEYRGDRLRLR